MTTPIRGAPGAYDRADHSPVRDIELMAERLKELVRAKPLLTLAAAAAFAGLLGGAVFSRMSRLLCLAAVGFAANELLHRKGRFDLDDLISGFVKRASR